MCCDLQDFVPRTEVFPKIKLQPQIYCTRTLQPSVRWQHIQSSSASRSRHAKPPAKVLISLLCHQGLAAETGQRVSRISRLLRTRHSSAIMLPCMHHDAFRAGMFTKTAQSKRSISHTFVLLNTRVVGSRS